MEAAIQKPKEKAEPPVVVTAGGWKSRLYFLFPLTFIPLAFFVFNQTDDLMERIDRTLAAKPEAKAAIAKHYADEAAKLQALREKMRNSRIFDIPVSDLAYDDASYSDEYGVDDIDGDVTVDAIEGEELAMAEEYAEEDESEGSDGVYMDPEVMQIVATFGIEGAHMPLETWGHWIYALLAAGVFFGLVVVMFERGSAEMLHLVYVALFTATFGIVFLLMLQWIAEISLLLPTRGFSIFTLVAWLLKFVAFFYFAAMNPDFGFWPSLIGFTLGIGLCEEITKALPVMMRCGKKEPFDWRGACIFGLASGVGFGVAEGILYASQHYNGFATGDVYLVRFVSCVALHAVWGGAVGISVFYNQELFEGAEDWGPYVAKLFKVVGIPILLHGLYNTFLKLEMAPFALLMAVLSFAYLAMLIEWCRTSESPARRRREAIA